VLKKNHQLLLARTSLLEVKSQDQILEIFKNFDAPELIASRDRLFEILSLSVLQDSLDHSNYELRLIGDQNSLRGSSSRKLIEVSHFGNPKLKLGKIGHTNAADAGLDIWSNFGVVINVKSYNVDETLFRQILQDTPLGNLLIVCKSHDWDSSEIPQIENRAVAFITEAELFEDLASIFSDPKKAAVFTKQFLNIFDAEFPLMSTLENFMNERGYALELPDNSAWR
jgi:hypothetical protein